MSAILAASIPFLNSESVVHFAAQCFVKTVPADAKLRHALQLSATGRIAIRADVAVFAFLHFICSKTVELIAGKTGMKAVISTAVSK